MAIEPFSPARPLPRSRRLRRHSVWAIPLAAIVVAAAALGAAVLFWSGASLGTDPTALARIHVQPLGGSLVSARASGPGGRPIPLSVENGRLTPRVLLRPGERVSVEVVVRRPGWLGWAIGHTKRERLTVVAPVATVRDQWLTLRAGTPLRIRFDTPVSAVVAGGKRIPARRHLRTPSRVISLGRQAASGSMLVAAAARPWERLGRSVRISWFPRARLPVVVSTPAPGRTLNAAAPITLTFSKPLSDTLGSAKPTLTPRTQGRWHETDSHTLVFTPSGFGPPLGTTLQVRFPRRLAVSTAGGRVRAASTVRWAVPPGSVLRLHQLLAMAGYLPVDWTSSDPVVARTPRAQVRAAFDPPRGHFVWRYPNTPPELRGLWNPTRVTEITRGAVMMFQDEHHLTVDALAGQQVWRTLLKDTIAAKRRRDGYSYVYVHASLPQSLNLWHNGQLVLSSPGNTGIPAAPTQHGTFPVFEHIPVGTMSGTNPDGSHYNDPGIRWISYFNGGDAIHAFTRASFGTPQSLGCVELPLDAAAKVWPYTPIGTLVTVED